MKNEDNGNSLCPLTRDYHDAHHGKNEEDGDDDVYGKELERDKRRELS